MANQETALERRTTKEALEMITEQDIEIGRYSSGWDDDTDFDALPARLVDVTEADVQSAELFQGEVVDTEIEEFAPPVEHFPVFKQALRHFQEGAARPRMARIDTPKSYDNFACERAFKEIETRLNELRTFVEEHNADHHGGEITSPLRKWDEILGSAQTIADLSTAKTADEAVKKFQPVPISVPDYAEGKVNCWQGADDAILVSIRFAMPDGSPRIATMGSRPMIDEESIVGWAEKQGIEPMVILGLAPTVAAVVTGKRLMRDAAAAALEAQDHPDVSLMHASTNEPVVLIGFGESTAPLAALMYLQQRADSGDMQALKEMTLMNAAAKTPIGQRVAAPLLAEASRRLNQGRVEKQKPRGFFSKLANVFAGDGRE